MKVMGDNCMDGMPIFSNMNVNGKFNSSVKIQNQLRNLIEDIVETQV